MATAEPTIMQPAGRCLRATVAVDRGGGVDAVVRRSQARRRARRRRRPLRPDPGMRGRPSGQAGGGWHRASRPRRRAVSRDGAGVASATAVGRGAGRGQAGPRRPRRRRAGRGLARAWRDGGMSASRPVTGGRRRSAGAGDLDAVGVADGGSSPRRPGRRSIVTPARRPATDAEERRRRTGRTAGRAARPPRRLDRRWIASPCELTSRPDPDPPGSKGHRVAEPPGRTSHPDGRSAMPRTSSARRPASRRPRARRTTIETRTRPPSHRPTNAADRRGSAEARTGSRAKRGPERVPGVPDARPIGTQHREQGQQTGQHERPDGSGAAGAGSRPSAPKQRRPTDRPRAGRCGAPPAPRRSARAAHVSDDRDDGLRDRSSDPHAIGVATSTGRLELAVGGLARARIAPQPSAMANGHVGDQPGSEDPARSARGAAAPDRAGPGRVRPRRRRHRG